MFTCVNVILCRGDNKVCCLLAVEIRLNIGVDRDVRNVRFRPRCKRGKEKTRKRKEKRRKRLRGKSK